MLLLPGTDDVRDAIWLGYNATACVSLFCQRIVPAVPFPPLLQTPFGVLLVWRRTRAVIFKLSLHCLCVLWYVSNTFVCCAAARGDMGRCRTIFTW